MNDQADKTSEKRAPRYFGYVPPPASNEIPDMSEIAGESTEPPRPRRRVRIQCGDRVVYSVEEALALLPPKVR